MRGSMSWLKNGRVALAAIGLATGIAGMSLGTGAAHADDWRDHRGRVEERHADRGERWRHERWERDRAWHGGYGYRVYDPYPVYYAPRVYYPTPYYYDPAPHVSLGFTFR